MQKYLQRNFLYFIRFPLYSKGRDKRTFEYGVFLLNKNIAQVSCSLSFFFTDFYNGFCKYLKMLLFILASYLFWTDDT